MGWGTVLTVICVVIGAAVFVGGWIWTKFYRLGEKMDDGLKEIRRDLIRIDSRIHKIERALQVKDLKREECNVE